MRGDRSWKKTKVSLLVMCLNSAGPAAWKTGGDASLYSEGAGVYSFFILQPKSVVSITNQLFCSKFFNVD